jgi:hypothetical protein
MDSNDDTNNDDILIDTEIKLERAKKEQDKFISHINEIENLCSEYNIEDMGNESSEQEYIMYIEDHCKELRELIDKLYKTKLYIIKNDPVNNNIEFYRDKIGI